LNAAVGCEAHNALLAAFLFVKLLHVVELDPKLLVCLLQARDARVFATRIDRRWCGSGGLGLGSSPLDLIAERLRLRGHLRESAQDKSATLRISCIPRRMKNSSFIRFPYL
jgi:hypothetical protein